MLPIESPVAVHLQGESRFERDPWPVDTPGGRYWAEFDDQAPVTRLRVIGFERESAVIRSHRFVDSAYTIERKAQVIERFHVIGPKLERTTVRFGGFLAVPALVECVAQTIVRIWKVKLPRGSASRSFPRFFVKKLRRPSVDMARLFYFSLKTKMSSRKKAQESQNKYITSE